MGTACTLKGSLVYNSATDRRPISQRKTYLLRVLINPWGRSTLLNSLMVTGTQINEYSPIGVIYPPTELCVGVHYCPYALRKSLKVDSTFLEITRSLQQAACNSPASSLPTIHHLMASFRVWTVTTGHINEGWKEDLLQIVDADVLPAFLGGNRTDPDGDPMCKSFKYNGSVDMRLFPLRSKRILCGSHVPSLAAPFPVGDIALSFLLETIC
ncbi:hypothetical protein TNCV_1549391 [Trichonephila clavipes]|nr:hypothetical protein TNCV_1549391 [Trichonephila clavipes]